MSKPNWLVAIARIEIRNLLQSQKRTLLTGALIGLPVAAIVFTCNLLFVAEMTPEERAIATALAAEEAKLDQRILMTVGASPAVYRNQASARSALLAWIGSWLSIPAGVLPAYGMISLIPRLEFAFPWAQVTALGLGLPVVAYVSTWLILFIRAPRPISQRKLIRTPT